MKHKRNRKSFILLVIILLLVLVFLYSGLRFLESTVLRGNELPPEETTRRTVVEDGVEYFPRQDITVVLLAGIDEEGPVKNSGSYNNTGEADMVSLLIFDHKEENLDILCLNRDTMLDIPVLGIGGKRAGTLFGQLALAHTYGSGLDDSCINLRQTVSDFFSGLHIDYYISLNMDAIEILNDAVGGVTVEVTDDFSAIDPTITKGRVTLMGKQATTFVRTRQGLGDGMNVTRMERQTEYMRGFLESLGRSLEESKDFIPDTYSELEPYMVTDCTAKTIAAMLEDYAHYPLDETITLPGENIRGKKFMEFHVDDQALENLVLQYFYAPKQ